MKKIIIVLMLIVMPWKARADLWGGDLPLLTQIVFNTLHTMYELTKQTRQMEEEMAGIGDRIQRVRTIADVVQPSTWDKWKDPKEALDRLRLIYHTIPKEYRSEKYDTIESELAQAMNMVARLGPEASMSFKSGKELERRGADASPGVAQKLTASGVGSLIALESQTQVIQSHIASLLTQVIAEGNEKETRAIVSKGSTFRSVSSGLDLFSRVALGERKLR